MRITLQWIAPREDLYYCYTGTREISPATSKVVNDKMLEKIKSRGYIMNKCGRKCYMIPGDNAFNCLIWCIEQSIRDLMAVILKQLNEYCLPYGLIVSHFREDVYIEGDIKDGFMDGLELIVNSVEEKATHLENDKLVPTKLSFKILVENSPA